MLYVFAICSLKRCKICDGFLFYFHRVKVKISATLLHFFLEQRLVCTRCVLVLA